MSSAIDLDFTMADKLKRVFEGKARYRGAHGGRGSTKSWGFAREGLKRAVKAQLSGESFRMLCTRELQVSIKDSVLQLLIKQIEMLGLERFFDYGESYLRGVSPNVDFIFKGLRHNIKEIKSTEGIDVCWIEEAETTGEQTFRVLPATIRKPGSEIWLTWNPESIDAPIQKRFIETCPDNAKVIEVNFDDNPWFSEELEEERQNDLKRDSDLYNHIWGGACLTRTDAQVLAGKWRVDTFTMPAEVDGGPYYGCDWGFSSDPMALGRCWINGNRLYIDQEAGGKEIEIKDFNDTFDEIPGIKKHVIRADNARPELISHMQTEGYRCIAADKWPGSIEDGITHLRSYDEIIIHERCVETAREARLWSYKVDKQTGDVLPVLIDANNHWMDQLRYALAPLIKKKKFTGKPIYAGQYNEILHISLEELWPLKNMPLVIGISSQQTTHCAVISQFNRKGQLRILEESIERDMGVGQFINAKLWPILQGKYRGCPYTFVSLKDTSTVGSRSADNESRLILDEMEEAGLDVESVDSNLLGRKMEAVRWYFGQLIGGQPAISISPACTVLRDGLGGGYQFRQLQGSDGGDISYSPDPEKNQYVLPNEALQHICQYQRGELDNNDNTPVISGHRTYST